jgi:hypothetical protein
MSRDADGNYFLSQEEAEYKPNYPHTFGPPSGQPPYSDTPGAEVARQGVRDFQRDKKRRVSETERLAERGLGGEHHVIYHRWPEDIDLDVSSIKGFLKTCALFDLMVMARGTRVGVTPELYAATNKEHAYEEKKPGYEVDCVFLTATNGNDFAVNASWEGKDLLIATLYGPRMRETGIKMIDKITTLNSTIARIFTPTIEEDKTDA